MNDQKIIKNIILDLGGVLVDIDPEKTYAELRRILLPEHAGFQDKDQLPEVVVAMETGAWTKEEFKENMRNACKPGVTDSQIVDAWCAMIDDFRAMRIGLLQKLAKKYNLYLLSNTNLYHVAYFEKEFKNRYHFSLRKLFQKVYYSHEIGFRKPHAQAFQFVLNDAGINPEETVMVDDRQDNCDAAVALGMTAVKVPENSGLEAVINQLL
jgi:glucose-1-phosphatase